jgi:hypothetical protein
LEALGASVWLSALSIPPKSTHGCASLTMDYLSFTLLGRLGLWCVLVFEAPVVFLIAKER